MIDFFLLSQTGPDATTLGMLLTAMGAMATAITILWKTVMGHLGNIELKLKDCEDDRADLWKTLAKHYGADVSQLKNEQG